MTTPTFERPLLPVATVDDAAATCETIRPYVHGRTSEIVFVHVIERGNNYPAKAPLEAMEDRATEIFDRVYDAFADDPNIVRTELRYASDVIEEIFTVADDVGASTVGFTPRPGNRLSKLLSRNRSRKLVARSHRPVTVFPSPERNRLLLAETTADPLLEADGRDEILVPFDCSSEAETALEYACMTHPGSAITTLHVVRKQGSGVYESMTGSPSSDYEEIEREERRAVDRLFERAKSIGAEHETSIETVTVIGSVANGVITYAEQQDVELIVLGRPGESSLSSRLLGSTTKTIIDGAPVAVTVVT